MNICIVGGGNIGTAMCSYIKNSGDHYLTVKTSDPSRWSKVLTYQDKETKATNEFEIDCITKDAEEAYSNADVVIITLPSFMIEAEINAMKPYIRNSAMVGVVPGSGGCEFYCKELIANGVTFFGMDRVPCVSRLEVYGKKVVASKKQKSRAVAIPNSKTKEVAEMLSSILDMEIEPLKNYLTVTFTPSNPIVHTSRLYAMFKDATKDTILDSQILFYGEWDDFASEVMLDCDSELHKICDALSELELDGVIPLDVHYGINSVETLTKKIKSIESMNAILSPLTEEDGKYKIDLNSRYFIEDFPYGLCIIKGFALIAEVETPRIDEILKWYEKLGNKEYFVNGEYCGKDLKTSAIPQNFNMLTKEDVYKFYK